jgi:O-antigen ligase
MNAKMPRQIGEAIPRAFVWIPSRRVEYAYYLSFSYSVIARYLGVEVPLVAAGIVTMLAGYCFIKMRSCGKKMFAPIRFLLAATISLILVQIVVYGASITDESIRGFILWIFGLIIVRSLCLRPGFLHRCTIVLFALGLIAVPHLAFSTIGIVERARADIEIGGGLQNANGLADWFGFCLVSFAISGLETKRDIVRILYWLAATGCLFIMGLAVSRGAMFAVVLATTVAFRGVLRRGFVPVLLVIIAAGVIYGSGLSDQVISHYAQRSMEETGREKLWPDAIERILASPLFGVGISNVGTDVLTSGYKTPPHNTFLYFALSSGVIPFAFYVAFWLQAAWRSFSDIGGSEYNPFRVPLLLYALVPFMVSDVSTEPWALLALNVGAGAGTFHSREGLLVPYRVRRRRKAPSLEIPSKPETIK